MFDDEALEREREEKIDEEEYMTVTPLAERDRLKLAE